MAKISKEIFLKMVENGFFDGWKTLADVIKKLSQKGHTIKKGKRRSRIAQTLTFLCQKEILEREELLNEEWEKEMGRWKYRKIK